ncbi:hypothetical protein VTO42DRAFT_1208 [Malbranchea cinnamomea]
MHFKTSALAVLAGIAFALSGDMIIYSEKGYGGIKYQTTFEPEECGKLPFLARSVQFSANFVCYFYG